MTTETQLHKPRAAVNDDTVCAICGRPITYVHVRVGQAGDGIRVARECRHVEAASFDGARQLRLYESLDVVASYLQPADLAMPNLLNALETIYAWRRDPKLWNVLNRWRRQHEDGVS